jgi:hypothetical protein
MIRILKADPIRQMLADIFPAENLRIVNLCFPELYLGKEVHNWWQILILLEILFTPLPSYMIGCPLAQSSCLLFIYRLSL